MRNQERSRSGIQERARQAREPFRVSGVSRSSVARGEDYPIRVKMKAGYLGCRENAVRVAATGRR